MLNRVLSKQLITAMFIGAMTISISACTHRTTGVSEPTAVPTPAPMTQQQAAPPAKTGGAASPTTKKATEPGNKNITSTTEKTIKGTKNGKPFQKVIKTTRHTTVTTTKPKQ